MLFRVNLRRFIVGDKPSEIGDDHTIIVLQQFADMSVNLMIQNKKN